MSVVLSNYLAQHLVDRAKGHDTAGADGPLYGAKMLLFTNNISLNPGTALGDLTAPTDTQLALSQAVTWSSSFAELSGGFSALTQSVLWQLGSDSTPATLTGWALEDSSSTHLLLSEIFDQPIALSDVTQAMTIIGQFRINGPDYGSATIIL